MLNEKNYSISELAEVAQVTIRTIRYYVAEELLPSPQGGGRVAAYSENHLARLKLIKILKDEFLPLHEIRLLLSGLDDQAVAELLAEKQVEQALPPPAPNSAKAYLQTLLLPPDSPEEGTTLLRHKLKAKQQREDAPAQTSVRTGETFREAPPPPASTGLVGASRSLPVRGEAEELKLGLVKPIPAAIAPLPSGSEPTAEVERWRRYQITPEVELHIKEGIENTNLWQKVEQLIKIARQILSSIVLSA
ncbi:MAG: MerR family transcriptional regulator [Chloroflexi bacterium]|nr:MerR family transcriptional regulator [Chloroflexota bacterium]